MMELTFDEINDVSGAINWTSAGLACIAFGGVAALAGAVPVAAALGVAGVVCLVIA